MSNGQIDHHGPLQAVLFHVAFWRLNLAYFDRYPLDSWPRSEVGVILWSLSASAHDWLPRETLTRLCATPVIGILESQWDFGFQRHCGPHSPTLGLVRAIGITKRREVGDPSWLNAVCTEKPLLFDRFVKFDVQVESPDIRH